MHDIFPRPDRVVPMEDPVTATTRTDATIGDRAPYRDVGVLRDSSPEGQQVRRVLRLSAVLTLVQIVALIVIAWAAWASVDEARTTNRYLKAMAEKAEVK